MWHNYFFQIQRKYSMRISFNKPLVIRLDGKNATKNRSNDFINDYEGTFFYNLKKTVTYFSEKYHCLAIFGSDEASFIFQNPITFIESIDNNNKPNSTNEIISLFSQYFFEYFNSFNQNSKIFWHGKCFSINEGKICYYLKYRSKIIKNVLTTSFLISKKNYNQNENLELKEHKCKSYSDYQNLERVQNGILIFNGSQIDLNEYYNGNITYTESTQPFDESIFSDLLDPDKNLNL